MNARKIFERQLLAIVAVALAAAFLNITGAFGAEQKRLNIFGPDGTAHLAAKAKAARDNAPGEVRVYVPVEKLFLKSIKTNGTR